MPPEVLSLLAEMLGERLPIFMFTSRVLFKQTLQGQLHFYEIQRQMVIYQSNLMERDYF